MMAEQKYAEVQKLVEVELALQDQSMRFECLRLYQEILKVQDRALPISLIIELAKSEYDHGNFYQALKLMEDLTLEEKRRQYQLISKIQIAENESKGQIKKLYNNITDFLLFQFEHQIPVVPDFLKTRIEKFFKDDFRIKLNILGITLLQQDMKTAEKEVKGLILSCVEKSSLKGIKQKITAIDELLKIFPGLGLVKIYQNLCQIWVLETIEKKDLKKIIEMCIYFDDYKFQILVLNLLDKLEFKQEAKQYAESLKQNAQFDYVYVEKYFKNLKQYFVKQVANEKKVPMHLPEVDLKLEEKIPFNLKEEVTHDEPNEEEQKYFHLLKYQNFTFEQLCDLTVSFLQSEMPRVAVKSADMALELSQTDREYLKASYLKVTSLLQIQDNRAALDVCFNALGKAREQEDILSFLYAKAEIYLRLLKLNDAKKIFLQIHSIDSSYRMTRERLEKLNEI